MLRLCFVLAASLSILLTSAPTLTLARPAAIAPAAAQPGFPVTLSGSANISQQSPVIADIVPGNPGLEMAIASDEGNLYVVGNNGRVLWQALIPPSVCGQPPRAFGAPAVGAIDGNGVPYVVIGFGSQRSSEASCPGGVAAFDGRNGALRWRVLLNDYSPSESLHGVNSTPALADVDGDGTMEVAFGGFDRYFYFLDHNGSLIWRFQAADTMWSSPAFADVDGDGRLDVVFGADIAANDYYKTINGGFVYAFKTTPIAATDKTIKFSSTPSSITNLIWRTQNYNQVIYSSPAIADVNGDGRKEVIVGSGCFYPRGTTTRNGAWVKVLDAATGNEIRTLDAISCTSSSPAIADVNGDGVQDIVINICGNVIAWSGNTGTALWTARPAGSPTNDDNCNFAPSPVVADIDGNGSLEVISSSINGGVILNGTNGAQLNGASLGLVNDTPAIGDLDGNGTLEIVSAWQTQLSVLTGLSGEIASPANPNQTAYAAPWPMFHGNPQRTGVAAAAPTLVIGASSINAFISPRSSGQSITLSLTSNTGSLAWTASADQPWISLNKGSGTTPDTLVVTLDPAQLGRREGTFDGTVTIATPNAAIGVAASGPTAASSKSIPVRLIISANVQQAFLPIVVR